MRVVKMSLAAAVLTVALSASAFAQATTPPAGAKPQTPAHPPATPPAPQPAAPKTPPAPFPQDAKVAFIDINAIAGTSSAGKEASKRLADLNTKKMAEIQDKNKQLQALQTKLNTGGSVLNDTARTQLEKDIDKM